MDKEEDRLAQELWESREDPEEWSDEAVDVKVRPKSSTVVSFRLQEEELDEVEEAAEQNSETISQFIRGAIKMRLNPSFAKPEMKVIVLGAPDPLHINVAPWGGSWTEAAGNASGIPKSLSIR